MIVTAMLAAGLVNAQALQPYFNDLARGQGVHILQIGDSHTAGDAITGSWRELLQAKYGSGGRGVLPPGRPYQGYLTRGVRVETAGAWRISSTFGSNSGDPRGVLGISGFSLTSQESGARMSLAAEPGQAFDRFTICATAERGAGALIVRMGLRNERLSFGGSSRTECRTINSSEPRLSVDVTTEGGPVTITSWGTFRSGRGVTLSNLGVVGSQLVHFARTDDGAIAEELKAYRPDLIVLAFGTNEGFSPIFRPSEYEIVLRTQIARIRRLSGGVPILLLGAPDASSRRPEMLRNAAGPSSAPCSEPVTTTVMAAPRPAPAAVQTATAQPAPDRLANVMAGLRGETVTDGEAVPIIAPPAPVPAAVPVTTTSWRVPARPLFPPAGLAAVRDVQRRVASALDLGFWDWEAAMGGRCAAVRWVKGSPQLMRGDYVHFNSAGGHEIAKRLQADLDRVTTAR